MHARARSFLTDLRGPESTQALSTRLGYASDVVAEWEAGRTWPTAAELFRVCGARRIDVHAGLRRFAPDSAHVFGSGTDREIAGWLRQLCAGTPARQLAAEVGRPTATVRRWLGGQVRPTFPELLALLDALDDRAEDFLQSLLPHMADDDPASLPARDRDSARRRAERSFSQVSAALDQARQLRSRMTPPPAGARQQAPPSAAGLPAVPVLVDIEEDPTEEDEPTVELFAATPTPVHAEGPVWEAVISADYRILGRHRAGWLEARTGLDAEQVAAALATLEASGRLQRVDDRWQPTGPLAQRDEQEPTAPRAPQTSLERLARQRGGQVAVSLSQEDLDRVRTLRRRTRDELLAIAASSPKEVLALVRVDG